MHDAGFSLLQRARVAVAAFIGCLRDPGDAARIAALLAGTTADEDSLTASKAEASRRGALQMLALLQQQGRLIDFLEEDIGDFSDQDVGAAARLVHQGCGQVLTDYATIQPVRDEAEGSTVGVDAGFDAAAIRLTGHLVGQAPFSGKLVHRGWRAVELRLPQMAPEHDFAILAAAEVEL
jgi:hypothetical protein